MSETQDANYTNPISRSSGSTEAEKRLIKLCERSFLSLWSFANVYRDERSIGKNGLPTGDGKEVADVIVVFGNDVIVFSDKDCGFKTEGNIITNWMRWFKKSVWAAAEQAWGAEHWLRDFQDRLYLDRDCTEPFPIDLPISSEMKVHHVVVAHNSTQACKVFFNGGSGSLCLNSTLKGREHFDASKADWMPFSIGDLNPSKGFVHVLDDTTLDILLETLDTISDFTAYLRAKEDLFRSNIDILAAGEEELLAHYLKDVDEETGNHVFRIPQDATRVIFQEGSWSEFSSSTERRSQVEADDVSYYWDRLIERFNRHIISGAYYHATDPSARSREKIVRFMASETRFRRRWLARAFMGLVLSIPRGVKNKRAVRVLPPDHPSGVFYLFLVLTPLTYTKGYHEDREAREALLKSYCYAVRHKYQHAKHIVGIACGTPDANHHSEDIMYLDGSVWDAEMNREAEYYRKELNMLNEISIKSFTDQEYPSGRGWERSIKVGRNDPCHCGSGIKYKKCHGLGNKNVGRV